MKPKNPKKNDPYFDDCPVCQSMKKMGIRPKPIDKEGEILITPLHPKQIEALRPAFRKAGEQGGIVGGEYLENENDIPLDR